MHTKFEINEIEAQVRAEIRAVYPRQFSVTRKQLAELISVSEGHIANLESDKSKKPLIEPRKQGNKQVVYHLIDVIQYLTNQRIREQEKRRGPSTKVERIEGVVQ